MILKNLLRRKARTALTLIGVAIGVAAIVALGAIGSGLTDKFDELLTAGGADLTVLQAGASEAFFSAVDVNLAGDIAAVPGVAQVEGVLLGVLPVSGSPYFLVYGYDPAGAGIERFTVTEGRELAAPDEILLGRIAAGGLGISPGDSIALGGSTFQVSGLYETGITWEDGGALLTLAGAQKILKKTDQVSIFQVWLAPGADGEAVRQRIEAGIPDVGVLRASEVAENTEDIQVIGAMAWAIAFIAIVVGGLGMMNAILMSVFERTREIGALRALGWSRWDVLTMILGEALTLSALGWAAGILMACVLLAYLGSTASGQLLGGEITFGLLFQSVAVTFFLGTVGGLYPAWRAARMAPADALRAEGGNLRPPPRWIPIPVLRDALRNRTRGILTLGGVALGVAVVVALVGLGEGFVGQYKQVSTADDTDLVLRQADVIDISLSALDGESVGAWLSDQPQVAELAGQIIGFTSVPASPYFLIFGVEPDAYITGRYQITEGRTLRGGREIIIGRQASRVMELGVGDELSLFNERFPIVGIFETGVPMQDGAAVMPLAEAQQVMRRPGQVTLYFLRLRDRDQADEFIAAIQTRFPEVMSSRAAEFFENTRDIQMVRGLEWGLGVIALLVGGVVMLNTTVMSVYERRREIGTLRALGWSRLAVLRKVSGEALALSISGGLLGLLLGLGLVSLAQLAPAAQLLVGGAFTPALLAQALGLAVGLGLIGGIYPAWRASRLAPAEALRYE
ncbi:MAG: hypothetical protein BMS9Abin28_0664 [Anaerolineae bacterium]|nr:MAG: hypothetical protein BMS9Abin28_0664 [Anaerolineae bacterium]